MENWETGGNQLKENHFEFPSEFRVSMRPKGAGPPRSGPKKGLQFLPHLSARTFNQGHLMQVTRQYRNEPLVLEELVDVLYRLLVDLPENETATVPERSESPCFAAPPE